MNLHIVAPEPEPLEIDPRPCELCGLTIDRHEMVDDGDGPIFFCVDTFEADSGSCVCGCGIEAHIGIDYFCPVAEPLAKLERRAELRRQEEVAAIIARWEAKDALASCEPLPPREPEPYRPAQSTVDAFWFVVGLRDPERFKAWLADRPKDTPFLLQLLESK